MERLTERHNFEIRGLNGKKYNQSDIVLKATGQTGENYEMEKVYEKLCEIEDFMEEQGFESLEELKLRIEYYQETIDNQKFNYDELHKYKNKLHQENQALKERWQKLKLAVEDELAEDKRLFSYADKKEDRSVRADYVIVEEFVLTKMQELEEEE